LCAAQTKSTAVGTQAKNPPNIVLITVDTLRADRVGCYGYKQAATPHIDRLAAEGVRFAQAYTPVPITLPAHAVMFTGKYPMAIGMHDFSGNRLSAEHATLASVLRAQGYATAGITSSAVLDRRFGLDQGFEFYYDNFDFSRLDETNLDAMERPGEHAVGRALEWLGRAPGVRRPFFLWVHLYDPHHPYTPPAPYRAQYAVRPYDGEIAYTDAQVGRLLEFLRAKKLYENTLVVLVGDHGEALGERGEKTHGFFIYQNTLHVPLIFKLPGAAGAAAPGKVPRVVATPATLVDLMPTMLQAAGLAPPKVQGKSLLALLRGRAGDANETIYAETYLPRLHFNWSELRSVRVGRYRLIDAPRPELYDLEKDPGERQNIFEEQRAVAAGLRKQLARVIAAYSPPAGKDPAEQAGLDPVLAERLKSLGYVAVSAGADPTISNRELPDPKDRIETYELISEGIADSQQGRYAASIAKLQTTLKTEKDSIPVHYLLALNYYRMQDYASAVQEFESVLRLNPSYTLAIYYLGLAHAKSGNLTRAIALLEDALRRDPTNFSAAFNLGAAYLQQGRVDEALERFAQSVKIYPEYAQGHVALGEVLLHKGRLDEAIAALRKGVKLAPTNPRAYRALARALEAKGEKEEAAEMLRKAEALRPK
jgi:arylsulfatase A-like enzyme/cytochrome c-type biogenesis protein CcmH/NrfG